MTESVLEAEPLVRQGFIECFHCSGMGCCLDCRCDPRFRHLPSAWIVQCRAQCFLIFSKQLKFISKKINLRNGDINPYKCL